MADPVYNPNLTIPISGSVAPPQTGSQTIIVTYPKRSSRREGYKSKPSQICGILLIMSVIGSIITQSVGFAMQKKKIHQSHYGYIEEGYFGLSGVWTSPFVLLAASFAIVSSKTKRVGLIIATLVMSILSAVFVVFVIGLSSWVIAQAYYNLKDVNYRVDNQWNPNRDYPYVRYMIKGSMATGFFMLLCGIIEFFCSIFLSTLCCKVLYCSNRQEAVTTNNSQVIFMNNTPVPIDSQPLQMTNPETQVLMSPPMYAPGQSVFQASGGIDLPPPYTDAEMPQSGLQLDVQYSEKVPLTD